MMYTSYSVAIHQETRQRDDLIFVHRPILSMWQFDRNNGKIFHLVKIKDLRNLSCLIQSHFNRKNIYYPVIFHSFMCGLPYRIRLALVRHGLSDWPFCGQIEVTKWAFAVIGHHSSLCPKDTTFTPFGPGVQVRKKK